jgi:multidrug efflux system membrane fusion protein
LDAHVRHRLRFAAATGAGMTRGRRIGSAVGAVLAIFVLYEIATSFVAYTADAYVRSDLVALAPQVTGRITEVNIADNQTVTQGDLLATIDPVPSAQATLTAAMAGATYAHETQSRLTVLATAEDASRAALQRAEDEARQADAAVKADQAAIAQAQATSAMHQATQAQAEAALATAEWQLARTKLVAPTSGTITNLTVRAGDTAQADVPLIGIVDARAWRIIANYKQSFIRGFKPGDMAWVWLDSQPWHLHRAQVAGIARGISRDPSAERLLPYVAPTTDWIRLQRRFPVTLTLVDPPPDLTLYMGADARVLILP